MQQAKRLHHLGRHYLQLSQTLNIHLFAGKLFLISQLSSNHKGNNRNYTIRSLPNFFYKFQDSFQSKLRL